jgi:hypothetical protein
MGDSAQTTEIQTHATTDDLKIDSSLVHTIEYTAAQSVTQHTMQKLLDEVSQCRGGCRISS